MWLYMCVHILFGVCLVVGQSPQPIAGVPEGGIPVEALSIKKLPLQCVKPRHMKDADAFQFRRVEDNEVIFVCGKLRVCNCI